MYGRNYLEEAFACAILAEDSTTTQILLPLLHAKHAGASLTRRDKNNESLLTKAFAHGKEDIATELLLLLKNEHELIFDIDDKQRTLLWHAANRGFYKLIPLLLELADKQPPGSPQERFWQRADHRGDTPWHCAAKTAHGYHALGLLIQRISREANAIELINRPNREGKTALHYAFDIGCFPSMSILVNAGADIFAKDNQGIAPFAYTERFTETEQLDMCTWIADKVQNIADESQGKKLYHYQLIENDRATLAKVLDAIYIELNKVMHMKKIPDENKKMAVALPALILLAFVASCYWMLTQTDTNLALLAMTLFCKYIIAIMAAIGSSRYFWNKEVNISGSELRGLQNMIQANVIDRLQLLPVNDKSPPIGRF